MKTNESYFKTIILAVITTLLPFIGCSQWEPDLKLTSTPGSYTSDNNSWCIAAWDNQVHVVWVGALTATDAVLYKRSPDGGISWNEEVLLSAMFTYSSSPAIAVYENNVHVAWSQAVGDNNSEIFYNHSTDGGATWLGAVGLTNSLLDSQRPVVGVEGQNVYVIWEDSRDYPPNGNYMELYFKKSSDGGVNWSEELKLTAPAEEQPGFPSIAVRGGTIHLAYSKTPFNVGQEIYYCRSTDQGGAWSDPVRLSFNNQAGVGRYPTIGANGENVYVFWSDSRDEGDYYELYFTRSQDAGETWGNETRLTFAGDDSYGPNIAVSGDALHLTWNEHRDGNWEIYYKNSMDNGMTWSTDTRLTNDAANSWYPSIAVAGQTVNVAWCDNRTGDWNIYYKRDPSGNPVGVEETGGPGDRERGSVMVFPNPTSGKFQITSTKYQTNSKFQISNFIIELVDLFAKPVAISPLLRMGEGPGAGNLELDISGYPAGIYFVRISLDNELILKKIVKL